MGPTLRQPRIALALALAMTAGLCAWGAPAVLAAPAFPTNTCGHFLRSGERFTVYDGGGVSCARATKLIKDFAFGKGKQHGTTDANSYWTVPGEPGFKCIESQGQGECYKGSEVAGYKIKTVEENEAKVIYPVRT